MKSWYKSKTVWLNLASVVATFVGAISQVLPSLQGVLGIEAYVLWSAVIGILNIVLRTYFTSTAIE